MLPLNLLPPTDVRVPLCFLQDNIHRVLRNACSLSLCWQFRNVRLFVEKWKRWQVYFGLQGVAAPEPCLQLPFVVIIRIWSITSGTLQVWWKINGAIHECCIMLLMNLFACSKAVAIGVRLEETTVCSNALHIFSAPLGSILVVWYLLERKMCSLLGSKDKHNMNFKTIYLFLIFHLCDRTPQNYQYSLRDSD